MPLHHFVPRFLLQGFANERGQVAVVAREDSTSRHLSSVRKSAAEGDYYSLPTEVLEPEAREGHNPEEIEQRLAAIEGEAAVEIDAIRDSKWQLSEQGHYRLVRFAALQLCRGPSFRKDYADLASSAARRSFRSTLTKDRVRDHLQGLGLNSSEDRVEALFQDALAANFALKPAKEHVLQESMRIAFDTYMPRLWQRAPRIIRFEEPLLLTSDSGVGMWARDPALPRVVGVDNARAIVMPLNRHTAFALMTGSKFVDGYVKPFWASHINLAVADRATRSLYHHPDDDPVSTLDLPPLRRLTTTTTGYELKDDGSLVRKVIEHWE